MYDGVSPGNLAGLLSALRAAAEPTRLRLLVLCSRIDLTVSQLVEILGQSQPRVSRHLKLLSEAGLLERLRESGWVIYRSAHRGPHAALARSLVEAADLSDPQLRHDLERLADVKRARADAALAYFNRNARSWNRIRKLHVDEVVVERALRAALPRGRIGDLLDIGTGTGRILELVSDRVDRAVGIDLSREMLNLARANLEKKALRHCRVQHADMYRLPMPDASMDVATIHMVLHFAEHPRAVIAEAARVLRPGGTMLIVDFAPHGLEQLRADHRHVWLGFDDRQIDEWAAAAGLVRKRGPKLKGARLTVCLWRLQRPGEAASKEHDRQERFP